MNEPRRPEGYVGRNHETIGSDLLSILAALRFPDQVLGKDEVARLAAVDPAGWYPIGWLLQLMETIDQRVGYYGLVTMGRKLFKQSHEEKAKPAFRSAHALLSAFPVLYTNANRGEAIGGWELIRFDPGVAEMKKTTPHHCAMEHGLISAAMDMVGVSANVNQSTCFRRGDGFCTYVISTTVRDARWGG
jgi:hypothetical protein